MGHAFEVIGSIAILQQRASSKELKGIAQNLLSEQKNIRTVFAKTGRIKGRLRKRELRFLAGVRTFETVHRESGCLMKLNLKSTYFSPRLSNDRIEVMEKVKGSEKVLVLFSGIGPYALVIAKHKPHAAVTAVELNKEACAYARENVKLNKLKNLIIVQGDVKRVLPLLAKEGKKFDRIMMARPQLKDSFLKEALSVARKGTFFHYHGFCKAEDVKAMAMSLQKEALKSGRKLKILNIKRAGGEIAPHKMRARIDFKVV